MPNEIVPEQSYIQNEAMTSESDCFVVCVGSKIKRLEERVKQRREWWNQVAAEEPREIPTQSRHDKNWN